MQQGEKKVKSGGVVVGTAVYPIWDTLEEAVAEVGESKVLEFTNAQIKTNRANQLRQSISGKPSRANLMEQALSRADFEVMKGMAGDKAAIANYMAGLIAEIEKERAEQAGSTPPVGEVDDTPESDPEEDLEDADVE